MKVELDLGLIPNFPPRSILVLPAFEDLEAEDLEYTMEIAGWDTIAVLDCSASRCGVNGIRAVVKILSSPRCCVQLLNLEGSFMFNSGASEVSKLLLRPHSKLRYLRMHGNEMGPLRFKQLCVSLSHANCNITFLDLSNNKLDTSDAIVLANTALQSDRFATQLEYLNLESNKICMRGLQALACALKRCVNMRAVLTVNNGSAEGANDSCALSFLQQILCPQSLVQRVLDPVMKKLFQSQTQLCALSVDVDLPNLNALVQCLGERAPHLVALRLGILGENSPAAAEFEFTLTQLFQHCSGLRALGLWGRIGKENLVLFFRAMQSSHCRISILSLDCPGMVDYLELAQLIQTCPQRLTCLKMNNCNSMTLPICKRMATAISTEYCTLKRLLVKYECERGAMALIHTLRSPNSSLIELVLDHENDVESNDAEEQDAYVQMVLEHEIYHARLARALLGMLSAKTAAMRQKFLQPKPSPIRRLPCELLRMVGSMLCRDSL